jgi:hypothetical protein
MKKILVAIALFIFNHTSGQIVLDTIVQPWNLIGYDFYPVKISSTETKYYVQDTLTNSFNLYNLDFTPFLLNVSVPESYSPFTKNMEVIYITRTLFDCDSTNIEYAYTAIGAGFNPFYIMRTDGTMLFKRDSALAPYNFGAMNGSQEVRPIMNTEVGAKLFLYAPKNTHNLHIYSLCGKLDNNLYTHVHSNTANPYVNIYPNPSTGNVFFQITFSDNVNKYNIDIFDDKGTIISSRTLEQNNFKSEFNLENMSNGQYNYNINSNNRSVYNGKFIITK